MKKKPVVYWLHSHFLMSTGGTRFVFEVISRLKKDYQVVVIVEKASPVWRKKYQEIGVKLHETCPLTSTSPWYWLTFPIWLVFNWLKLKQIIPAQSVIVSSMFPMPFLAHWLSSKNIYYCFEPFAFFYDRDLIQSFPPLKRLLLQVLAFCLIPLDKFAVRNQTKLVAINPSVGKYITNIYKRTIDDYSYLGVDTDFFKPRKPTSKNSSEVRLFHSTDYSPLKGTEYLLAAFRYLEPATSNIRLYISESLHKPEIKQQYLDYLGQYHLTPFVTFLGHLDYQSLPQAYSDSHVYCFTGDPGSTGATAASLSVLEASACELPIIRSTGNDDEVIDGQTGFLVDPRRASTLAKSIKKLAGDPQMRVQMGKKGRLHVLSRYTWDKVTQVIKHQIELVLGD